MINLLIADDNINRYKSLLDKLDFDLHIYKAENGIDAYNIVSERYDSSNRMTSYT